MRKTQFRNYGRDRSNFFRGFYFARGSAYGLWAFLFVSIVLALGKLCVNVTGKKIGKNKVLAC